MKKAYIFIGIQGSGKGTQAKILAKKLSASIIESGEIFRSESKLNKPDSLTISNYIHNGMLVPDNLLFKYIERKIKLAGNIVIIDGLPRTLKQKEALNQLLLKYSFINIKVIHITISDEEALKRTLARGRIDDNVEIIKNRIIIYHKCTEPIIKLYKCESKLIEIDGMPSVEVVSKSIINKLNANEH